MNNRILFLFLFGMICFQTAVSAAPQQVAQDSAALKVTPLKIEDINYEMGKVEKEFKKFEDILGPQARMIQIDTLFTAYSQFLQKEAREFKAYNPYHLSKFFLENTYRSWERFSLKLQGWQTEVNNQMASTQSSLERLASIKKVWKLTLESENFQKEPEELKKRIQDLLSIAENLESEIQKRKRSYIILEDKITEMSMFANSIIVEVSSLQQHLRDSLFVSGSPPLWQVSLSASDYGEVANKLGKFRYENVKTVRNYTRNVSLLSFWISAFLVIVIFFFLRRSYQKLDLDDSEPGNKNFRRIFQSHPFLIVITLIIICFHLLYPYHPLIIGQMIILVLLINMRFILQQFLDKQERTFVNKVILLLLINNLEIVFWYFGNVARYYILLESMAGLVLMAGYLRPALWHKFKARTFIKKGMLLLALFSFSFYVLSFFANLFGFLNLSVLFLRVSSHVPEFSIILFGFYKILETLILVVGKLGHERNSAFLETYLDIIEKRLLQLLRLYIIYNWFLSLSISFEVSRVIGVALTDFLVQDRIVGTLNITIGGILALILIVIGTFLLTGILKILIEDLILKKSRLPRGVPAAISVTIRYFLVVLGFMFALSAAGIELGKFSLLAGALGVGIGFGLQNIVNNFISGIILVYERPLQVGDTIEVENLLGQVNRIGIRSSNVRTYDGAEVVVPNGNLISNQLINWTLSDNKRRIEVKVGVSYGSDPNQVLKLLEEVAMENDDTLKEPPPRALFEGFGDSSLNFRLLFWVPYDIGIGTKSDVAVGIFNKFKEHKVEIPFPQVDLHVKEQAPATKKVESPEAEETGKLPGADKDNPLPG